LPDGASPLTINCDYNLGKVFQRPGKESVFTYETSVVTRTAAFTQSVGSGAAWSAGAVTLNNPGVAQQGVVALDKVVSNSGNGSPTTVGPLTPAQPNELAFLFAVSPFIYTGVGGGSHYLSIDGTWLGATTLDMIQTTGPTFAGGGGNAPWSQFDGFVPPPFMFWQLVSSSVSGSLTAQYTGGDWNNWVAVLALFKYIGVGLPTSVPDVLVGQYRLDAFPFSHFGLWGTLFNPGKRLFCIGMAFASHASSTPIADIVFSDPAGNNYQRIADVSSSAFDAGGHPVSNRMIVFICDNYVSGQTGLNTTISDGVLWAFYGVVYAFGQTGGGLPTSQTLQSLNFGPPIPANVNPLPVAACGCGCTAPNQLPVFGLEVLITGSQTNLSPDAVINVQLQLPDGSLSPKQFTIQLPSSTGTVVVGSPTEMWGVAINAAMLNDPNFTVNLVASAPGGETVTFNASVTIEVFTTPNPPADFNYLKTFAQTDGDLFSLALGSDGVMYQEDAINLPDVLLPVYSSIFPDSFAESCTVDDREFIAISNLLNGTDIPYTYDGVNFDRLSQVGPGTPPTASTSTATTNVVSITQPTPKSDVDNPGHLSGILWSNGPGSTAPGNVLTVYYTRVSSQPVADPDLQIGVGVTIAGVDVAGPNQDFNGQPVDGNYTVVSVGQGVPPGAEFERWYFTVTMPSIQSVNQANHITAHAPLGTYQVTTATLTSSAQVPNVEVGSTIQIAGTGGAPPAGYDGSWTVTTTPNASQLQITSTTLNGNVATYGFNLITGTNPVVGQKVTITGTLNGNGIFNVVQGVISSTSPGIFSILLTGPNTPSAAETGTGIIFGTIFTFEPGQPVGTRLGGTIITLGVISAGVRKVCYSFLTRNGYMTAPSPVTTFDVPSGASVLTIGNLATGPSDVIARVVHLTAANGSNFYNIPIPVTVLNNGINVVNSSTYVNDNTSRSVNLSFSDGVLLAADAIDIQGNNLFATLELGSVLGLIGYASRVFAIGEQNKVPNFLNWSFDGGYLDATLLPTTIPLGWTRDATSGPGGSLVNSPIFGFAYQIQNATGSTQPKYGMITQPAFQDEFMVPIIRASTKYSTRITAAVTVGGASGNLVVDLFSPALGTSLGTFSVPLASLTSRMAIFSGPMLTNVLAPVPSDLLLRIYATAVPDGTTIIIDRNEPFPTEQPNLSTQATGSYVNNFEAFDESGNGGIVDTAGENQQDVRSAFTLYDTLYLVKTGSFVSTQDNGSTEPSGWSLRIVSNSVGTPSIYGVTSGIDEPNTGEAWAIIAGQAGGYIFNGGEPIKITEEIQSLWNYINWAYGHTLWVKNDVKNRRIYFAVPLKTPNPWLPTGIIPDDSNPTTPNVILMLNYKQLNTGATLAEKVGVHTSYSGRLIASELTRKWSIWTIKAPCAAFLRRADKTDVLFLGNSDDNGKIFQLDETHTMCGQDDCSAMVQIYNTYGFVTDEQAQALRLGSLRKYFSEMFMVVRGSGNMNLRVFPDTLESSYAMDLLPRIPLPLMNEGDIEVPVDQEGNRLFVQFKTDQIGACFELSRMMMAIGMSAFSPTRGRNG
jgi:hypothetical protein